MWYSKCQIAAKNVINAFFIISYDNLFGIISFYNHRWFKKKLRDIDFMYRWNNSVAVFSVMVRVSALVHSFLLGSLYGTSVGSSGEQGGQGEKGLGIIIGKYNKTHSCCKFQAGFQASLNYSKINIKINTQYSSQTSRGLDLQKKIQDKLWRYHCRCICISCQQTNLANPPSPPAQPLRLKSCTSPYFC